MTDQQPAVTFLLAAQGSAVDLANSATPGPWYANEYDIDMEGFAASIGTRPDGVGVLDAASDIVGNGYEGGGVVGLGDAQFIAAQPPEAVLLRVAAERELLAEHAESNKDCSTCVDGGWGWPIYSTCTSQRWPCRTVLGLAKAWGWEEQHG